MKNIFITKRGFTAFFAVLVASLALSVGLAIYDLLIRQLTLSQVATQSVYAIFAADAGIECALYWDNKYVNAGTDNHGGSNSVFSSSTPDSLALGVGSGVNCNGQDITAQGPPQVDFDSGQYTAPCSTGAWCVTATPTLATTTFRVEFTPQPSQTYCAVVSVGKFGNPSQTTIISRGFNTCAANAPLRIERALQVSY